MSQIEWSMWANEQGVLSGCVMLVGGAIGVAGQFHNWEFGIYSLIVSVLILMMEWPRGKRIKGNTVERRFQRPFAVIVNKFGVAGQNYFIRFVLYLILCVPCCIILSTLLGGVSLLCTSIIYFVAAMKGEEWRPTNLEPPDSSVNRKRPRSLHPPNRPPPRTQGGAQEVEDNTTVQISTIEVDVGGATAVGKKPTRPPPRPKTAGRGGIQQPSH